MRSGRPRQPRRTGASVRSGWGHEGTAQAGRFSDSRRRVGEVPRHRVGEVPHRNG